MSSITCEALGVCSEMWPSEDDDDDDECFGNMDPDSAPIVNESYLNVMLIM